MKFIIAFLIFLPFLALGQEHVPPAQRNTFVNDIANKLTEAQKVTLNEQIYALQEASSVQLAVVLVDEVPEGTTIEEYARNIGNTWHVGYAQNGLVYVAAINQRKQRLEVAKRLEGTITDFTAVELTGATKPFFRAGDYFGGLTKMIDEIRNKVDPARVEQIALVEKARKERQAKANEEFLNIFLWVLGVGTGIAGAAYLFLLPGIRRRKAEEAIKEREQQQKDYQRRQNVTPTNRRLYTKPKASNDVSDSIALAATASLISHPVSEQPYSSPSKSEDSSSSYGDWGGGSSDSSSNYDSGSSFGGGGGSSGW